jgi:hypothetical protein
MTPDMFPVLGTKVVCCVAAFAAATGGRLHPTVTRTMSCTQRGSHNVTVQITGNTKVLSSARKMFLPG